MRGWAEKARRLAPALVAGVVALTLAAPAQAVTREQANAIALAKLRPQRDPGPVALFGLSRPLAAGTVVTEGGGSPAAPRVLRRKTWLFWIDHEPRGRFVHPSTLLLVDDARGRVVRTQAMGWWPEIDGERPPWLASPRAYGRRQWRVYSHGE
jgi:hypothetical protein